MHRAAAYDDGTYPRVMHRTTIVGTDSAEAPLIQPGYLATEHDRRTAAQAIRITRAIVGEAALAPYHPEEVRPGPGYDNEEELQRAASEVGTTIFHPAGTAAMGTVFDSQLRVIGLDRLRVIDASVMPRITSGNTNAPVMMIAEKGAEMILESSK